jgi:hypothetical protein
MLATRRLHAFAAQNHLTCQRAACLSCEDNVQHASHKTFACLCCATPPPPQGQYCAQSCSCATKSRTHTHSLTHTIPYRSHIWLLLARALLQLTYPAVPGNQEPERMLLVTMQLLFSGRRRRQCLQLFFANLALLLTLSIQDVPFLVL